MQRNFITQLLENLKEERCIHQLKTIFRGRGVDLADMQLISKCNKRTKFFLCVIDVFIKCAWVVPLKDKRGVTIVNAFQNILDSSKRKPNEIWVDQGSEFYNNSFKKMLLKDLLEH